MAGLNAYLAGVGSVSPLELTAATTKVCQPHVGCSGSEYGEVQVLVGTSPSSKPHLKVDPDWLDSNLTGAGTSVPRYVGMGEMIVVCGGFVVVKVLSPPLAVPATFEATTR